MLCRDQVSQKFNLKLTRDKVPSLSLFPVIPQPSTISTMSSGSITISYTTLAEIAVAAAVIGGVAFIGSKQISSNNSPIPASSGSSSSSSKNKSKKKRQGTAVTNGGGGSGGVSDQVEHVSNKLQESVNQVQESVKNGVETLRENESVKKGVEQVQQVGDKVQQVVKDQLVQPATANGGGKNKKKKNKGGNKTPPTTSSTQEKEKKEDMRDYELEPENPPARVMKIVGGEIGAPPSKNGAGSDEWEKPDGFGGDDEGEWESVVSKS